MCPESLKTHHAVPLFFTLPEYAYSGRRSRSPSTTSTGGSGGWAAPGLCFRAGLRSVRGGFVCHPVRLSFSRLSFSLPPFLVQSTSSKSLGPRCGNPCESPHPPATTQPFPMPRPQNTVCDRYSCARSIRPDRRTHRGLACDSFSAEGHWSPDRKHGLLPYNSFLPRGQYLYIKSASKAADPQ